MGVKIEVRGGDKESDEYEAALKLKDIIKQGLPPEAEGELVLFASATLVGQAVKDVDLLMIGHLSNYRIKAEFCEQNKGIIFDTIDIGSFCTVIEIKRHDISGIYVNGTDFYVKYGKNSHCVTAQSNKQKISAMNFFQNVLSFSPYITNIIWFTQATKSDISGLISVGEKRLMTNVLGSSFEFKELLQLLIYQKPPYKTKAGYRFDSNVESVDEIGKALTLFVKTKTQMGELTRRRIEQITNSSFEKNLLVDTEGKVSIYRGRAGTGKTVGLIQTAIRLVDEEQARVLLLTYNKALVSDIRRLFALAELPDMFEENCVCVNTMHSYFFQLANKILYEGKMSGDKFISNYEKVLNELNEFLADDEAVLLVQDIINIDYQLKWDYILLDEAQDWTNLEKDIVLKLFDKGRIIVADGGMQFVRHIDACDWSMVQERNNIKLKYCLRQKENIIAFLNVLTKKYGILGGKILSNNSMVGGRVIVTTEEKLLEIHKQEINKLREAGNIAYDMLYLVPHCQVKKKAGDSYFVKKAMFENAGISVWDGTSSINRENYPIYSDEIRVLQYDSARGLEGWTVVCCEFDKFLEEKESEYREGASESLMLESPEERKKRYLYNWAMIPLTRAIDTLIVSLSEENANIGVILKEIAEECPDIVTWI